MLCAVVTTMTTSLYFLIPGTNPNAGSTPVWSVLVSLLLSLSGLVLWKKWESATPAEEQYAASSVAVGGAYREGVFDKLLVGGQEEGSWSANDLSSSREELAPDTNYEDDRADSMLRYAPAPRQQQQRR